MIKLTTQDEIDDLLSSIDWSGAFLREVYLGSPTRVVPPSRGVFAHAAQAGIRLLIVTPEYSCPALLLAFARVWGVSLSVRYDLHPSARLRDNKIEFMLNPQVSEPIVADFMYYKKLGEEVWGDQILLGRVPMFDSLANPIINIDAVDLL
jgi:hypothetical protein